MDTSSLLQNMLPFSSMGMFMKNVRTHILAVLLILQRLHVISKITNAAIYSLYSCLKDKHFGSSKKSSRGFEPL